MQDNFPDLHKYVYSSEMVEFVKAANDLCQFFEHLKDLEGKAFIIEAVKHFSAVYASYIKTGKTVPLNESPGDPTVTEMDWAMIHQQISMTLSSHNDYLRLADEDEFDRSEVVTHTIAEDASDVYQELRNFLSIYSRGMEEFMNDAAWELRERFAEHWGKKLLRSLMALHNLYIAGVDPTEKE